MEKEIFILGIGHNTPVYIDLCKACGYHISGLYHYDDTRTGQTDHGYPVLGSFDDLFAQDIRGRNVALSQGDNAIRADLFGRLKDAGANIPTLIHPSAQVSRFATLAEGAVVHINTVIHPDVEIGENTVLSDNVSVSHSTKLGKNCYVALGAMIGAYITIEDNVFIGIGANLISGKVPSVGNHAYIAAGALITKSVPAGALMVGAPAKQIVK